MAWSDVHESTEGVTAGEARSVTGPIGGCAFPVAGGANPDVVIDLRELRLHYVRISAQDRDVLYVFSNDPTASMDLNDRFDPTSLVPDIIWAGTSVREIVPRSYGYLHVRAVNDTTGTVRVRRA